MEVHPDTIVSRAIPDHVAELLGHDIIAGVLAPNYRLTEENVADAYGVSRSPVREGLRLLERDGLVRRSARRGIWVAPLSLRDFDEVYLCRASLESVAAQQAAASPEASSAAAAFTSVLQRLQAAQVAGDISAFFKADVDGSELIYRLTGNVTLQRLLGTLEKQALRYRYYAYAQSPVVVRLSIDGSAQIFDSIGRGRAAAARRLTERLFNDIWRTMRPVIEATCPEQP